MKIRPLIFAVLVVMFAASGCLFTPDDPPTPPVGGGEDAIVWSETPDEAVLNWAEYYGDRDYERYIQTLNADYRFIQKGGGEYNYDQEIVIASKMFRELAGEGGVKISEITVVQPQAVGTWQRTDENHQYFPGSQKKPYEMDMRFKVAGQDLWYVVTGLVEFYVTSREVEHEGVARTNYEVLGQWDKTNGN